MRGNGSLCAETTVVAPNREFFSAPRLLRGHRRVPPPLPPPTPLRARLIRSLIIDAFAPRWAIDINTCSSSNSRRDIIPAAHGDARRESTLDYTIIRTR